MRTPIPFRWLAALVLWLGPLLAAHATHVMGGDIAYSPVASTTVGVPRYHVLVRMYLDPGSGIVQNAVNLTCARGGCGSAATSSFSLVIPQSSVAASYITNCAGGIVTPYNVKLYETDVDLPTGQWLLSVTESNRVAGLINMPNSVYNSIYISTYFDNSLAQQDSSPRFLSTLLPYICNNQARRYSFSTFDADGDSLRYEFQLPEMRDQFAALGCGTPAISTLSPHFALNNATGALTILPTAPTQQGTYVMAARVSEYRRLNGSWQLLGYVVRDVAYMVSLPYPNQTPQFTSLRLNGSATPQPLSQPIRAQPGQVVTLALEATDPDAGQTLRFESQAPGIVPGLSLATTGATTAQLTWQVPATLPPGRYTIPVAVLDNGCPNASEDYTFVFVVAAQPLAARPGSTFEATAYPTPFREQVQFSTTPNQAVVLFDALGREVARLSSAADGLVRWQPAPTLPAGLYFARSAASGQPLARLLRAE